MRGLSILALILCAIPALANNPLPSQSTNQSTDLAVNLSNPPVPVGGLTIQQSGAAGPTNLAYYYWIVTRTLIGNSTPVGPNGEFNASSTISSSNYFSIFWNAVPSATRYDVLRTTTPAGPSEACVCAVAVNTSSLSDSDRSNSLSAYTVNTFAGVGRGNATSTRLSVVSAGTGATLGQGYFWNSAGTAFALQTKIGYDARDYLQCDGSTDDTAALNKLLRTIGSTQAKIVLPNTGQCVLSNIVIPANLALDFSSDGAIKVNTRSTQLGGAGYVQGSGTNNAYWKYGFITLTPGSGSILILGGIINPDLHQIFYNATGTSGVVNFTGNVVLDRVYPEWWGASPTATAAINTPAIQAAENGAFGCGNVACRTNVSGLSVYNKTLDLRRGHYHINAELQFYHVIGLAGSRFQVDCGNSGGFIQTAPGLRIIDGQSVAYGVFDHCYWSNSATNPFQIKGSVTSGTFTSGEQVKQSNTTSVATLSGAVPSGGPMQIGAWGANYGTSWVDATDTWVGQTSGAVFTPTSAPYQTNVLVDIDYNGTQGIDLAPQFIDFPQNSFIGGGNADVGLLIAKSGGSAQGSNIYCWNCEGSGFSGAVWQAGGNNTNRNAGRSYAYNALDIGWFGGDMEANPRYGLAGYGAGFLFTRDVTFENSFLGQTGFDQYCEAPQGSCLMDNARSESRRPIAGGTIRYTNSQVQNQSLSVTPGSTLPPGYLVIGSSLSDGKYYKITSESTGFGGLGTQQYPVYATGGISNTIVDTNENIPGSLTSGTLSASETVTQTSTGASGTFVSEDVQNGLYLSGVTGSPSATNTWVGGTSGAVYTPTAAPAAAFTTNAFVGYQVSIFTGDGQGQTCVVTSNSTTTITCTNPWVKKGSYYAYQGVNNPGLGSAFIVEPNWGTQTSSSGMTWETWSEHAIQGLDNGENPTGAEATSSIYMDNDTVPGETIWATSGTVKNLQTTRGDWLFYGGSGAGIFDNYSGQIPLIDFDNVLLQTGQVWQFPRNNPSNATIFNGFSQKNMGTMPIVWSAGNNSAAESDVEIGGRNDGGTGGTGTNASRIIMQVGGLLGPPTPIGLNLNAGSAPGWSPFGFNCGLSTGSGTPGTCNWYLGTTGASGTQVNSGSIGATLSTAGYSVSRYNVDKAATLTVRDLTLAAGWGSTAAIGITLATSKDQASVTTITAGGTGIEAKPTYQLTFHDGTWTQTPVCIAIQTGGNDIIAPLTVTSRSATSYTFQWHGTPSSAKTYEISVSCMGT